MWRHPKVSRWGAQSTLTSPRQGLHRTRHWVPESAGVSGSLNSPCEGSSHGIEYCPHLNTEQCGCQQGAARAPSLLTSSRSTWGAPHAAAACEGLSLVVGTCKRLQLQSLRLLRKGKRQLRQFNKCSTRKDSILEALTLHTSHLRSPPSWSSRGLATARSDSPGLSSHRQSSTHKVTQSPVHPGELHPEVPQHPHHLPKGALK